MNMSIAYFGFWEGNIKRPYTVKWFFNVYRKIRDQVRTKIFIHNKYLTNPYINTPLANIPLSVYSSYLGKLSSRFDAVHVITQWGVYWKAAKYSRAKLKLITFHDAFDPYGNLIASIDSILNVFDIIITPSNYTRKFLVELNETVDPVVIYNSVNTRVFYPMSVEAKLRHKKRFFEKHGLPNDEILLLYVGTDKPSKNLERLIESVRILRENFGVSNISLIKVGPNVRKQEIVDFANAQGVRMLFYENVPDNVLNILYNISDIYVQPSLREGFGMPLIEAMATGTPVVGSAITSIPEVLGKAGLLFNPLDSWDIAKSIFRVLSRTSIQRHLSQEGLKRVKELFSVDVIAETYLGLLSEYVDG
ncbi:glycosyltransferase family 4 protein [Thermococcus sp. PK]|uniref:glycosyltransferase family 4 protein n=1 Tax=Thermococcus sp. PK TaxID=913025 RepID=UPI0005B2DE36|nr:glycosyltransferase family 1 protein [Thermococcus sp. PK]